jgi:hypothetical protein
MFYVLFCRDIWNNGTEFNRLAKKYSGGTDDRYQYNRLMKFTILYCNSPLCVIRVAATIPCAKDPGGNFIHTDAIIWSDSNVVCLNICYLVV